MSFKKQLKNASKQEVQEFISTGSDLLDLAISDKCNGHGGFPIGTYVRICGDSDAGKTFIALACLAEAKINPDFKKYRVIYDPVENGAMMQFAKYYGNVMAESLEMPRKDGEASRNLEDFYHNVGTALSEKKPFIYILDSIDALETKTDEEMERVNRTLHEKDKKEKESYGVQKAKINSKKLGPIVAKLKKNNSLLIIISQTRGNIGAFGLQDKKTVSGGFALIFHASVTIWLSKKGTLKKDVRGKPRSIGMESLVKVKRTRVTGRKMTIVVPIMWDIGIDNVTANIDYLIEEKEWKKNAGLIKAIGIASRPMNKPDLIAYIEKNNKQYQLAKLIGKVWGQIRKESESGRVNKYNQGKEE